MTRFLIATTLAGALLLSACASSPIVGQTLAGEDLRKDIISHIVVPLRIHTKCSGAIDIEARVIQVNRLGEARPGEQPRVGSVVEEWTLGMCGKRYPHQVVITPDPKGGSHFRVTHPPLN